MATYGAARDAARVRARYLNRLTGPGAARSRPAMTEEGKQRFRWVSGKTQAEALAKVAELKQQLATGTLHRHEADREAAYLEQLARGNRAGQVKPTHRTSFIGTYAGSTTSPRVLGSKSAWTSSLPWTIQGMRLRPDRLPQRRRPHALTSAARVLYSAYEASRALAAHSPQPGRGGTDPLIGRPAT